MGHALPPMGLTMPLAPSAPPFATGPAPPPGDGRLLPLHGLTVLAVEDSRCAADALRLMCQRSGARLRRAETLAAARAHLSVYRPDVAIIDLGLPDGRGEALIADLCRSPLRPAAVLGLSGDPEAGAGALAAGADGFLEKPVASLPQFQSCLLRALAWPDLPQPGPADPLPDPVALGDDLARAEAMVRQGLPAPPSPWLRGFVSSLARQSGDAALQVAARQAEGAPGAVALLAALRDRLALPRGAWR